MKKKSPKAGKRLALELRLLIDALHREGKTAIEIATETGIAPATARRWIANPAKPLPEARMLELLRQRVEQWTISRMTGVPFRAVNAFARKNGFGRPRWHPTTKQLVETIDLAFANRDSIASIARQIGAPRKAVARLVHKIRQTESFLTTATLDSYLPMKHRDNLIGPEAMTRHREEETMLYVLDTVKRACFGGTIPADWFRGEDQTRLIAIAIAVCSMLYQREKPEISLGPIEQLKLVDYFTPRFAGALDTLRLAEGPVN
jgi:hypothetical protein